MSPRPSRALAPPERTPRALRPQAPVAVSAALVSQLTSLPLLGVDGRRYLDLIVTLPACREHVIALGKLRLLPLDIAVEALRSLAVADHDAASPANDSDEDEDEPQPRSVDDVLRRVGRERVPGVARR